MIEPIFKRAAGLDVHKKIVVASISVEQIVTSEWVDFDDCQPPSSCDAESFGLFLLYGDSVPVCEPVDDEAIACSESLAEAKFSESDSEEEGMLRREFSMMPPSTEEPIEQQNFKPKVIKPRLF